MDEGECTTVIAPKSCDQLSLIIYVYIYPMHFDKDNSSIKIYILF